MFGKIKGATEILLTFQNMINTIITVKIFNEFDRFGLDLDCHACICNMCTNLLNDGLAIRLTWTTAPNLQA